MYSHFQGVRRFYPFLGYFQQKLPMTQFGANLNFLGVFMKCGNYSTNVLTFRWNYKICGNSLFSFYLIALIWRKSIIVTSNTEHPTWIYLLKLLRETQSYKSGISWKTQWKSSKLFFLFGIKIESDLLVLNKISRVFS